MFRETGKSGCRSQCRLRAVSITSTPLIRIGSSTSTEHISVAYEIAIGIVIGMWLKKCILEVRSYTVIDRWIWESPCLLHTSRREDR